jgi:uncharacterized protein (DUF58 family)
MLRRFLFHNFRIISRITHWGKRRLTQAGMLAVGGVMAGAIFGIDTNQTLAYQLFALLFTLVFLAFIISLFFNAQLSIERKLPDFATAEDAFHYRVKVYNTTNRLQKDLFLVEDLSANFPTFQEFTRAKEPESYRYNWFDNYVGYPRWAWLMKTRLGAEVQKTYLPPLPPHSSIEITMELKPLRRGYIHFSSMSFGCPDPFGLINALRKIKASDSLLVLPKRYPVTALSLKGSRKYQRGGVNLAMSVGDSEEFTALREYRPGDALRHIHWKSWARTGKPIIKEFQDEFFVRHALILDTFTQESLSESFENAVSVAASFAASPRSHEVLLDLMFVGTEAYRFTSGRGLAQIDQLLEILACVQANTEKTFSDLSSLIMQHSNCLSACICVLLNWDISRQYLIQQLENMNIPLIVIVVNDKKEDIEKSTTFKTQIHFLKSDDIAEKLATLNTDV